MTANVKNIICARQWNDTNFNLIPPEFAQAYSLYEKVQNGYVYMRIVRGMYGLPQAGMLANQKHGYFEVSHTLGLFAHKTRPIWFTLVVDNFGIK